MQRERLWQSSKVDTPCATLMACSSLSGALRSRPWPSTPGSLPTPRMGRHAAIVLASTFAQPEPAKPLRFDYSRSGNPTRAALEECLAALEGGSAGFAFASGCAAATTLLHTLRPGDHVLSGDDVYGGTFRIFDKVMGPLGSRPASWTCVSQSGCRLR